MNHLHQKNRQGAHGGEVFRIARQSNTSADAIADFSSNANSLCRDLTESILFADTQGSFKDYNHYPDTWSEELTEAIATHESVSTDEIIVGHGSTETIFLTFQQIAPERVLLVGPMFSEYEKACKIFAKSYDVLTCSPENGFAISPDMFADSATYDLIVFCSPNNPATITYDNMQAILSSINSPYILIDSTYREFMHGLPEYDATRTTRYRSWCNSKTKVITMHSFTKFFYCTGVRLGYAISDADTIALLRKGKMPWTVTAAAQRAGVKFLSNIDAYRQRLPQLRKLRNTFVSAIKQTNAFAPERIFAGVNYLFCQLTEPERGSEFYDFLLKQNILVRLCDNIPGTEKGFIRMQVKTPSEWAILVNALTNWASRTK